jgi:ATP-dependent helicase/nuclease subunit A
VGDAKQSIYRFRGADVTVFRDVQARIERIGAHIALTRTYRAHESLTEGLNALLAPLMEKREGDEAYMVPFAPLEAARQRPETKIEGPYVELLVGLGKDADQGRDVAARALASRLWALHTKAGVDFGEMALLFRASTGFPQWEDALEKAEIPFITVAGRGFFDRPEVRDILGALKALANPADDLAMTGLLRSPAIGISDASIYRLRWDKENTEGPRGLWRSLHNCTDCLSEPDRSRAERALEILTPLQRIIGRLPVVTVMKRFLDETGYQAIARRSGDERARRNIEKLLTNAHRSQQVSVSAFLEYVRTMRDVSAREGEAPVEAEGAVQLMTIHQAKGLEFPVVVLADLGRSPYRGRNGLLLSRTWGPLIPLQIDQMSSIVYALGKQREQDKEEAEAKRLLYVAATRAADKLILNGHGTASTRKNGTLSIQFRGWLGTIGETLGADKKPWKSPDIMQQDSMPIRLAQNPDWIEGTLYTSSPTIPRN